ncbi:MAG: indole-3-glycerol phosphate synthase TrpC [Planctomycetes bacterium]|nr:indole-3-glycerol phosphate synthase TrpC [Planctomycetota bacterium]MBI3848263.1 indole-3-glycerol phosphate synthase TrpC [Planctomycetota bacterium]
MGSDESRSQRRVGLDEIAAYKRKEVAARKRDTPVSELERRIAALAPARSLADALRRREADSIRAIAEVKRASPSRGPIRLDANAAATASAYARSGAAAISVLTESRWFRGSDDDVRAAKAAVSLPILRKDFVVDAFQVVEARAIGADAVLLLVSLHPTAAALRMLLTTARSVGIEALVEAHDERELDVAREAGATLIGINNRNLATFAVDRDLALRLIGTLPRSVVRVAESGISTREAVVALEAAGADAILVGEALMSSADPGRALRRLLGDPGADQARSNTATEES